MIIKKWHYIFHEHIIYITDIIQSTKFSDQSKAPLYIYNVNLTNSAVYPVIFAMIRFSLSFRDHFYKAKTPCLT